MVDSLSSYKVQAVSSESDETEIACLAAVAAYIQLDEEEQAPEEDVKPSVSPWGRAALLEGAGVPHLGEYTRLCHLPLWRNFLSLFASFIAASCFIQPACAEVSTYGTSGQTIDSYADDIELTYAADASVPPAVSDGFLRESEADNPFLAREKATTIRVALAVNAPDVNVDTTDGARVFDIATGKQLAALQPLSQWKLAARTTNGASAIALSARRAVDKYLIATGENLQSAEKNVAFFPSQGVTPPAIKMLQTLDAAQQTAQKKSPAPTLLMPGTRSADGQGTITGIMIVPDERTTGGSLPVFSVNGRMYRGALCLLPAQGANSQNRVTAINVIDLEDYLMSVLPSEMPSSWPAEALKAQAIAARSYAIANLGKHRTEGFDVKSTVMDQAYRGVVAETNSSNMAVSETRGIVMKHQGKVVPGFFHSTSAGATDLAEHVWTKEVPYLKAVPDVDLKSKYVLWERKFSTGQVQNALGKDVGTILGLFPVSRSPSGRIKHLLVIGSNSSSLVTGATLRQQFSLPSTNFNVLPYQDAYLFKGQGFGHGLGMSQWGARTLAEHGYNAAQILTYYYKDVTFEHIIETSAL